MEVKKTTDQVVTAYRLINSARLSKMEDAEKFALIKAARRLKGVSNDFEELLKDAQEKLKPDGFDGIIRKVQAKEELTGVESEKLRKYNTDVQACVQGELEKEVELDFAPLTEEAIGRLIASNDFSVSEILAVEDVIGG